MSRITYMFGPFSVASDDSRVLHDGAPVAMSPRVFETLLLLLANAGRLIEKQEFLNSIWKDSYVEEVALSHAISQIRKALGDNAGKPQYIETVSKRGYRFIAPVQQMGGRSAGERTVTIVAVLPFEDLGVGETREYLADGLTEELIAALGQVDPEHLGIIGRTSMMAYRKTSKSLAQIGRELDAAFLVESSLRSEADLIRITSKLIRARDQVQIWCDSYDSRPASILEFQRGLCRVIAEQVRLRLSPDRLESLATRQTRNTDAYDLYLRGRYFWNQLSAAKSRTAVEHFSRAVELDPQYALAWSGLADAYATGPISGDLPPARVWRQASEAVANAVKNGGYLAEVQTSLGYVKFWLDWDWSAAEQAFRSSVAIDSRHALGHRMLGVVLSQSGRHEEALGEFRLARELDPLDFVHQALSAQALFNAGEFASALEFARAATALNSEFWIGYYQMAQSWEQLGRHAEAMDALRKAHQFSGGNSKTFALRGYILAKTSQRREALEVIETLQHMATEKYVPPYAIALVYAGMGEAEAALQWLGRAFDVHDVHLALLATDHKWNRIRSDPRFAAIIQNCAFVTAIDKTSGGNRTRS